MGVLRNYNLISLVAAWILVGIGSCEAAWGLLQIFRILDEGNTLFVCTGSFYNPGPWAGCLACCLPSALWLWKISSKEWMRMLAMILAMLMMAALPASMSRGAWLAALAGTAWVLPWHKVKKWMLKKRISMVMASVAITGILVAGLTATYWLKPESAEGRLLIWKIGLKAAHQVQPSGVGWERVAGVYGQTQEEYFESGRGTEAEKMVAGVPTTMFNEYLQIATAWGLPALLALLSVAGFSIWRGGKSGSYGLCGSITAFLVFAFGSYPLQFPLMWVVVGTAVVGCLVSGVKMGRSAGWVAASSLLGGVCLLIVLLPREIDTRSRTAQLWKRGYALHQAGHWEKSNIQMQQLIEISSDPMPLVIMGKNFHALAQWEAAERSLQRAAWRVPNRLYPHFVLCQLYADTLHPQPVKLNKEAELLLSMPVKVPSPATEDMRTQAKRWAIASEFAKFL